MEKCTPSRPRTPPPRPHKPRGATCRKTVGKPLGGGRWPPREPLSPWGDGTHYLLDWIRAGGGQRTLSKLGSSRRERIGSRAERDVEKEDSTADVLAELRRLADVIETRSRASGATCPSEPNLLANAPRMTRNLSFRSKGNAEDSMAIGWSSRPCRAFMKMTTPG